VGHTVPGAAGCQDLTKELHPLRKCQGCDELIPHPIHLASKDMETRKLMWVNIPEYCLRLKIFPMYASNPYS